MESDGLSLPKGQTPECLSSRALEIPWGLLTLWCLRLWTTRGGRIFVNARSQEAHTDSLWAEKVLRAWGHTLTAKKTVISMTVP